MEISFTGKTALVTGASRGIGLAIVKKLIQCGAAKVYAVCRNAADIAELCGTHPCVQAISCDLSDPSDIAARLADIDLVHLLVNNVGMVATEPVGEVTLDAFDCTMNTNFKSALLITQMVGNRLRSAGGGVGGGVGGAIVNVSSIVSLAAAAAHTSYSASKAALDSLTRSVAVEWAAAGIRANAVNPTVVLTDMGVKTWVESGRGASLLRAIPSHEFIRVDEVVHVVCFLLSGLSSGINGSTIRIDNGLLSGINA